MVAGPGSVVTGEPILFVLLFLAQSLPRHPPFRHLFYVGGIGHIDNHQGIAIGPLEILQAQLVIPAAIEISVLATIVKIVMSAISLCAGVVFLQEDGLVRVRDVVGANAPEALVREYFVPQFLVVLTVRIFGNLHCERLRRGDHHDPFLDFRVVGDAGKGTLRHSFV